MKPVEKELCKAILDDPAAQAQIVGAADDEERASIIVRLGDMFGLPVSLDAVRAFFAGGHADELSNMELEFVVGGKGEKPVEPPVQTGPNRIEGYGRIEGTESNDEMVGSRISDNMTGGAGDDFMAGKSGSDTMDGGLGDDFMDGGHGNDVMDGGAGNDVIDGGSGSDSINGGDGHDSIYGNRYGGTGYSDIYDGDTLDGGGGNDYIVGGSGDDLIRGGTGNDIMYGGAGNDVFVFGENDGLDKIGDFSRGDKIVLEGADSNSSIQVAQLGGDTIIKFEDTTIVVENASLSLREVRAMQGLETHTRPYVFVPK